MKWVPWVVWIVMAGGCSLPSTTGAHTTNKPSSQRALIPSSTESTEHTPKLSDGGVVGRYAGIVPGGHGSSAELELRIDRTAVLTFKGGPQPSISKGTWKVWNNTVNVQITVVDGKPDDQGYLFTMNEEKNVLAGSVQRLGEQGPMLSLKRE